VLNKADHKVTRRRKKTTSGTISALNLALNQQNWLKNDQNSGLFD
jgi:hypothetical protein